MINRPTTSQSPNHLKEQRSGNLTTPAALADLRQTACVCIDPPVNLLMVTQLSIVSSRATLDPNREDRSNCVF